VNSGRATRERNIEQTAFKTNMEAADEAARQMRLRDLAGLIVIDFIDMEEQKNDRAVEKRMKENLRFDRARVQMGKISGFGLLELSRQRRRTGVLEGTSHVCEHCQGSGRVRSVESAALALLRALDEAAFKQKNREILARTATDTALYILNEKRDALATIEENRHVRVRITAGSEMHSGDFELNIGGDAFDEEEEAEAPQPRRAREAVTEAPEAEVEEIDDEVEDEDTEGADAKPRRAASEAEGDERRGRRRRGRRGGRRRQGDAPSETGEDAEGEAEPVVAAAERGERNERGRNGKRRRRGRGRGRRVYEVDGGEWLDFVGADLKSLSPRPEGRHRNGDARVQAVIEDAEAEADAKIEAVEAQVIAHPAAAPSYAPAPVYETAVAMVAEAESATADEEEPATSRYDAEAALNYEPDQERRDKFLSRFSRWGKKG
jgi:ribonuclease E